MARTHHIFLSTVYSLPLLYDLTLNNGGGGGEGLPLLPPCSHLAALFKIEAAVQLGYTKVACTDQACMWNASFVKDVKPDTTAKTPFFHDEALESVEAGSVMKRRKTAILEPLPPEAQ